MSFEVLSFSHLVSSIDRMSQEFCSAAVHAVNLNLTLRNWCIGAFITEFELEGHDRAKYGEGLFDSLSAALKKSGMRRCDRRDLKLYVQFYRVYPQVFEALPVEVCSEILRACPTEGNRQKMLGERSGEGVFGESVEQSADGDKVLIGGIRRTVSCEFSDQSVGSQKVLIDGIRRTVSCELIDDIFLHPAYHTPGSVLVSALSFSHIAELMQIEAPLKRLFYEVECIRGVWSLRELKRQVASMLFERTGLSRDKGALIKLANEGAEVCSPKAAVRDPYVFEFLGLRDLDVSDESVLEEALLLRLEDFLMELGCGFCFEGRQKKMLIGNEYYAVDLVFYHRILKCHVLVDLKREAFGYEHAGQMNMYLNWFRENVMGEGDNPPVGIVLCPLKSEDVVEYALAGLSNEVFVSKYEAVLPSVDELNRFVANEARMLKEAGAVYRPKMGGVRNE